MERFTMDNVAVRQPDSGLGYSFETTYTQDATRVQSGKGYFTPMYTVEQLSYKATGLSAAEMSQILKIIAKGRKFQLHYFSPYYGAWRDAPFYVGKGSLDIGYLNDTTGTFDSLSFNMTGVNPI